MVLLRKRPDFPSLRDRLVRRLQQEGCIKTSKVARALRHIPREEFIAKENITFAYDDSPISLGDSYQTISAPHMVAIMLEELDLKAGLTVLEIGSGSGYNAAVMAEIIRSSKGSVESSRVVSVERLPSLVEFSRSNLERTGYSNQVDVVLGDGSLGYPERSIEQVYDRIIVTAASPSIPRYLESQLKENGIILIPVGEPHIQNLTKAIKKSGRLTKMNICECMFVPLVGANGYGAN